MYIYHMIDRHKNVTGNYDKYLLQDLHGNKVLKTAAELKQLYEAKQLLIPELTYTKDKRIVKASEYDVQKIYAELAAKLNYRRK